MNEHFKKFHDSIQNAQDSVAEMESLTQKMQNSQFDSVEDSNVEQNSTLEQNISIEESITIKPNLKTYKTLKEQDIKDLEITTQDNFDKFVDDVMICGILEERIKKAPNVIYLGNLNKELSNALGLNNVKVYIRKNELHHTREERKKEYGQDVPMEHFKNLPNFIKIASEAYIDTIEKHRNFFLYEPLNDNEIITYHFNKDELGNYFITARRVEKARLTQKEYKLVRSGIAPHIQAQSDAPTLLTQSSLTSDKTISQDSLNQTELKEQGESNHAQRMEIMNVKLKVKNFKNTKGGKSE